MLKLSGNLGIVMVLKQHGGLATLFPMQRDVMLLSAVKHNGIHKLPNDIHGSYVKVVGAE